MLVSACLFLFYGYVVAGYISSTWLLRQLTPIIKWLNTKFGKSGIGYAQALTYILVFLLDSIAVGLFAFLPGLLAKNRVRLTVFLFIMITPIMFPNIRYGLPTNVKGWFLVVAPLTGIVCFAMLGQVVRRKLILHHIGPLTGTKLDKKCLATRW